MPITLTYSGGVGTTPAGSISVLGLIASAMRLIGVLASGESPRAEEASDALDRLNDILEAWRLDRLMVYNVTRQEFSLVSGQQVYSLGAGGDFNIERPVWLEYEGNKIVFNAGLSTAYELPLRIYTDQDWADVNLKTMASTFPTGAWFNQSYPLAQLTFWPIPTDGTLKVALMLPMPVSGQLALTDTLGLPPGYKKALRYALAVDLAPEFGRTLNVMVLKTAVDTKAKIMAQNGSPDVLRCDAALVTSAGRFSIFDGGFGRR